LDVFSKLREVKEILARAYQGLAEGGGAVTR